MQVRDTACSKNKLLRRPRAGPRCWPWPGMRPPRAGGCCVGTYKPVAELLRAALAEAPDANIHIAHFGAIRGLDGWKDFDTVIVAGREQPQAVDVENMARSLFGADAEPLLLTGEYVPQMRGHRTKDGTRTAVAVQVHPDLRVQALVEQVREREVEQMVGRLRLVHRGQAGAGVPADQPAHGPAGRPPHHLGGGHARQDGAGDRRRPRACCRCPVPSWRGRIRRCGRGRAGGQGLAAAKGW